MSPRVRRLLVGVGVTAFVALFVLLGADVTAPAADPDRADCGSPIEVLRRGSGYGGGEIRADEERFDAVCVARARVHVAIASAAGAVLVGVLGAGWVLSRRVGRGRTDLRPNYPVPR